MSILVIGIGNPLRGDDGAGPDAAQRLHALWRAQGIAHRLLIVQQLTPEIAEDLVDPTVDAVLFVDAAVDSHVDCGGEQSAAKPVEIALQRLLPQESDSRTGASAPTMTTGPGMTHHVTPAAVVRYAALLYGAQPACWVLSIPGQVFGFGARFSAVTESALAGLEGQALSIFDSIENSIRRRMDAHCE